MKTLKLNARPDEYLDDSIPNHIGRAEVENSEQSDDFPRAEQILNSRSHQDYVENKKNDTSPRRNGSRSRPVQILDCERTPIITLENIREAVKYARQVLGIGSTGEKKIPIYLSTGRPWRGFYWIPADMPSAIN